MTKVAIAHPTKRDSIAWVPGPAQKKIGELPDHQVAVVRRNQDGSLTRVARVSRGAGASVAQRLLGGGNVALGTHEGKPAWIAKPMTRVIKAGPARAHAANIAAAKGSVGKAHKPSTHARPHR
jgi:hypothetical protein